jgi:fused signal recognition particle receptor
MVSFVPPTLALAAPQPSPIVWVGIAVVLLVLLYLAYSFIKARQKKKADAEALERAKRKLPTKESAALNRAQADVDRARQDREAAELKVRADQTARADREAAAKARAETEAQARAAAQQRAEELKRAAEEAATPEERKKIREAAAEAEAEAAHHRKEEQQAKKRAEYEAKRAKEADEKAKRRLDDEAKKIQALESAKSQAEAEVQIAALKLARIEAESGKTLAEGLERTRGGFMARISQLVGGATTFDDRFIADLEEILFTADIGVRTAQRMLDAVREKMKRRELNDPEKVKAALREEIERIVTLDFTYTSGGMPEPTGQPQVIMIVGVNGSGKTTTIGKLAFKERVAGHNVLLGAGDTFRAAAAEQLDIWASRAQVDIVKAPADSDPAAVCFEAVKKSVDQGRDLCLLDTAGRLHTQVNLMAELQKVKRVVDKALPGAPHETWLVVDGTTGQNAVFQARQFHEALKLTGLVLTKLDGTAKGGVVIGICDELKVPIRYVGVGEKIGDLREFSPKEFVEALFGE